jgi:hypothetical protein
MLSSLDAKRADLIAGQDKRVVEFDGAPRESARNLALHQVCGAVAADRYDFLVKADLGDLFSPLKDFAPAMMGAPLIEDLGVVGEAIGNLLR